MDEKGKGATQSGREPDLQGTCTNAIAKIITVVGFQFFASCNFDAAFVQQKISLLKSSFPISHWQIYSPKFKCQALISKNLFLEIQTSCSTQQQFTCVSPLRTTYKIRIRSRQTYQRDVQAVLTEQHGSCVRTVLVASTPHSTALDLLVRDTRNAQRYPHHSPRYKPLIKRIYQGISTYGAMTGVG